MLDGRTNPKFIAKTPTGTWRLNSYKKVERRRPKAEKPQPKRRSRARRVLRSLLRL